MPIIPIKKVTLPIEGYPQTRLSRNKNNTSQTLMPDRTPDGQIETFLNRRLNKPHIEAVVKWALENEVNTATLCNLISSTDEKVGVNALWCLTHLQKKRGDRLQSHQNRFINLLLVETRCGKKRMLLQLLREQSYNSDTLRSDFLDYCLTKINSECEPYAIRAFSIYCAFKMCRCYPELIAELEEYLTLLATQSLSPGMKSAMATTRRNIEKLKGKFKTDF